MLTGLAVIQISTGLIFRFLRGINICVDLATSAIFLLLMFTFYRRFNAEGATPLETFSYWAIVLTFLVTQRLAMILDKTDLLAATGLRLLIFVPIYLYALASRTTE